jgi:hypothetical protein
MKNPVLMIVLISMTAAVVLHFGTASAMHDSNLDVNTWIARNNSTQLHTIDLNKGPISPPTAGATAPEETTGVTTQDPTPEPITPTSLDEDEDQASSSGAEDEDTLFEENESDGDGEEVE